MSVIEVTPKDERNPYRALVGSLNEIEQDAYIRVEPPFDMTDGYLDEGGGNSDGLTFEGLTGKEATLLTVGIDNERDGNHNQEVLVYVTRYLLEELGRVASPELFREYIEINRHQVKE
jgi:hypothetical protein